MKIGLYGGTFDPIHHGHLVLARTALEELALDRIIFIPAAVSPHKLDNAPTPAAIRWEMVQASIAGEPGFSADDLELHRSGPSYTYDTAAEYRARFPKADIFYFIGSDNLTKLHTWHRIDELREIVTLVVMRRGSESKTIDFPQITRRFDVSASEIRIRVANGHSIRYLVTPGVEEIIHRQHLYQNSSKTIDS